MGSIKSSSPPEFWRMCVGTLLFFLSFNLMLPELPNHLREIGGGKHIGWVISSFSFAALFARPLSGWVTDNLGRKWSMLGGTSFCIVAGLLYPLTQVVWLFFAVRIIHGFSTGFAPTGFTAFTTDIVPHNKRGEALGWQGMFSNIGASAGFAVGSLIAAYFGVPAMYIISSALALVAMFIFASLPETRIKPERKHRHKGGFLYFKAIQPTLIMLCVCVPIGSILTIMPDYTQTLGFKNKGLFLAVYIAFSLLVRIFSGKLSDKFGRPLATAIGSVFQIIALLLLAFFASKWAFFVAAAFYGFGQGFNAPSLFAWGGDTSTENTRGRAMGMLFIAIEIGIILGALSTGSIFNKTGGSYQAVFLFNTFWSVLALVLSLYYLKQKRGKSPSYK
ncbi:MAG: MFS transporter [Bacteroidia bacterium]|nr:MFS transporter [Bacteroidia bacterium]